MRQLEHEKVLIRYLLGELSQDEQVRVEDRLFTDDEYFEQLEAIREELADDYARGDLSARERERFERQFLTSTQGRQDVQFAKALAVVLGESETRSPVSSSAETVSWWRSPLAFLAVQNRAIQFSLAALMVVLLAGALWMTIENWQLRQRLDRAQQGEQVLKEQATGEQARNEDLAAGLQHERQQRDQLQKERDELQARLNELSHPEPAIVSFLLPRGLPRDAGEPTNLVIARGTRLIRLQLDLEGDDRYNRFRAEIRTTGGKLIWSGNAPLVRQSESVSAAYLRFPASVLNGGEYEVALKGVAGKAQLEDVGYYYFKVVRR